MAEARSFNTYLNDKDFSIDARFWDVFHSNFYSSVIFTNPKGKICTMHYIDFEEMRRKKETEVAAAITTCDRFDMTNIMSFRYDWNVEILAQFHATYFWDQDDDVVHWMTDKTHYRIHFLTFCQILGFGETHRSFSTIHAVNAYEISDIGTVG